MKYLTLLAVLYIAGCDSIGGIRHHAVLDSLPEIDCVERSLKGVDGVNDVSLKKEEGGRPLTFGGIESPDTIYRFSYSVNGLYGNFYFKTNYENAVTYTHTYMYINGTPPQSEIDTIHPIIKNIEKSLVKKCGVTGLTDNVNRNCTSGVKCI